MEYFASNAQLGGVQIMYHNGVSHKTERNDFDGVKRMLRDHSHITSKTFHATSLACNSSLTKPALRMSYVNTPLQVA